MWYSVTGQVFASVPGMYIRAPISADSVSAVPVTRGLLQPDKKKNRKIKGINGS
jgi:hypothetical protein